MTALLLSLPGDVLIAILVNLDVEDLLCTLQASLENTCRALYVFCASTDYIWHNIKINYPLNLPHQVITNIPSAELRKHCVEGLRIDHNWRKNPPSLKTLSRIDNGGIIEQMQYLPPKWLVSMSRVSTSLRPTCVLSIWDCDTSGDAKRIKRFLLEPHGLSKFSASLSKDEKHVLVVIFNGHAEILTVYHIPLQDSDYLADPDKYISSRVIKNDMAGSVFEADICGETVSCLIAQFRMGRPSYQVLFLNTRSGNHVRADVNPFTKLQVRLFPDSFLLLSGVQSPQNLILRLYDASSFLQKLKTPANIHFDSGLSLGTPCAEYSFSAPGTIHQEYKLSTGNLSTAALIFPRGTNNRLVRFPVRSDDNGVTMSGPQSELRSQTFYKTAAHVDMSPEFIALGPCGQRAVWLERAWNEESDRTGFNVMKGAFSDQPGAVSNVGSLIPTYVALPFEVETCQSIAFDEAMGRVFLGLYTGEIYVLNL
ncbi:hypothetical protein F5877DRAFT_47695 [Lentinula edodes]|nr:hypothetical protein F5877DRAFT_47695 [Lentinula edodes]